MTDRDAERQKRLKDALRENLKRRKNQSRGRAGRDDDPPDTTEAPMPAVDEPSRSLPDQNR